MSGKWPIQLLPAYSQAVLDLEAPSFDTIMEQNSFDKSSLQQDLLTSRFPATADDESSLGRQVASA